MDNFDGPLIIIKGIMANGDVINLSVEVYFLRFWFLLNFYLKATEENYLFGKDFV